MQVIIIKTFNKPKINFEREFTSIIIIKNLKIKRASKKEAPIIGKELYLH